MTFFSLLHNGKNHREILIRSLFFIVILFIFSKLWLVTDTTNIFDRHMMVWYIAITEIIILSLPQIQVDIENEIRNGDIVYYLFKPVSYLSIKITETLGAYLFRFLALTIIAIPYCIYMSGIHPPLVQLFISLILALIAGFIFIIFHAVIGLTAFKIQDATPIFWLWQRSSFLFGGMLLPLDFYPWYLQSISYCLPFAALLYAPARLVLSFSTESLITTLFGLFFWAIVGISLLIWLYGVMLKTLRINGG